MPVSRYQAPGLRPSPEAFAIEESFMLKVLAPETDAKNH